MPWNVFPDEQGQFCVYKIDDEGDQTGKSLGCHDDEESAKDQVKALYANVAHSIIRNARLIIDSLPKKPTLQYQALETLSKMRSVRVVLRGGEGSGNFGHSGRPGEIGGSGGGGSISTKHKEFSRNSEGDLTAKSSGRDLDGNKFDYEMTVRPTRSGKFVSEFHVSPKDNKQTPFSIDSLSTKSVGLKSSYDTEEDALDSMRILYSSALEKLQSQLRK